MRVKLLASSVLLVGLLASVRPLLAHHGTGVAYEPEKMVTVKGTVTDWLWSNPHCGLLFDVTDTKGVVTHWGAEFGNPHQLSGAGFSKETFKAGDKITVSGHPARSGAPRMTFDHAVLADGTELSTRGVKGNGERDEANQ